MAARVLLPPVLAHRSASLRSGIVSRVSPLSPPAAQLDQIVLWLTLQADELPTLEAAAAAPGLSVARIPAAPAPRPGFPGRHWWWLAAAALAAAGLAWRRRVRRNASGFVEPPMVWLQTDRPGRLGGPHSGGAGAVAEW
jgi:hypothetical protein